LIATLVAVAAELGIPNGVCVCCVCVCVCACVRAVCVCVWCVYVCAVLFVCVCMYAGCLKTSVHCSLDILVGKKTETTH
jgi:hypothetical protein